MLLLQNTYIELVSEMTPFVTAVLMRLETSTIRYYLGCSNKKRQNRQISKIRQINIGTPNQYGNNFIPNV